MSQLNSRVIRNTSTYRYDPTKLASYPLHRSSDLSCFDGRNKKGKGKNRRDCIEWNIIFTNSLIHQYDYHFKKIKTQIINKLEIEIAYRSWSRKSIRTHISPPPRDQPKSVNHRRKLSQLTPNSFESVHGIPPSTHHHHHLKLLEINHPITITVNPTNYLPALRH